MYSPQGPSVAEPQPNFGIYLPQACKACPEPCRRGRKGAVMSHFDPFGKLRRNSGRNLFSPSHPPRMTELVFLLGALGAPSTRLRTCLAGVNLRIRELWASENLRKPRKTLTITPLSLTQCFNRWRRVQSSPCLRACRPGSSAASATSSRGTEMERAGSVAEPD